MATRYTGDATVSDSKHCAFLLFWFGKYFVCISLGEVVPELQLYVILVVSGRRIAWGQLFLSCLYRALYNVVDRLMTKVDLKNKWGPLWFLQLWVTLYFFKLTDPKFNPRALPRNPTKLAESLRLTHWKGRWSPSVWWKPSIVSLGFHPTSNL